MDDELYSAAPLAPEGYHDKLLEAVRKAPKCYDIQDVLRYTKNKLEQDKAHLSSFLPGCEDARKHRTNTLLATVEKLLGGGAHNDHAMRHYDRTCPACNPAGVTETGKEQP